MPTVSFLGDPTLEYPPHHMAYTQIHLHYWGEWGVCGRGLLLDWGLGLGWPYLPDHEAEQSHCLVPRPSGLLTAARPHRSAGGRKTLSSCMYACM